jgi:hypothetical protein
MLIVLTFCLREAVVSMANAPGISHLAKTADMNRA